MHAKNVFGKLISLSFQHMQRERRHTKNKKAVP